MQLQNQSTNVVPNDMQQIPLLIGQPFTERERVRVVKNHNTLEFSEVGSLMAIDTADAKDDKVDLVISINSVVSACSWVNIEVR